MCLVAENMPFTLCTRRARARICCSQFESIVQECQVSHLFQIALQHGEGPTGIGIPYIDIVVLREAEMPLSVTILRDAVISLAKIA